MSKASPPLEKLGSKVDLSLIQRLLVFLHPYKKLVIVAILLNVAAANLGPLRPYLLSLAIDDYISLGDTEGLTIVAFMILGALLLQGLLQYSVDLLMQWVGQHTINDMRIHLFEILQRLKLRYFDQNPLGRLITRVTSDVEVLKDFFADSFVKIISNVFTLFFIVLYMFFISWQLALAAIIGLPLMLIATAIFRRKVRAAYREIRRYVASMNAFLNENITGISIVQLFTQEKRQKAKFDDLNSGHTDMQIRTVFYYATFFPVVEFVGTLTLAIMLWYSASSILDGSIKAGTLIAFMQLGEMFFRPIRELSEKYNNLQNAMASSERVFTLMDEDSFIEDRPKALEMPPLRNAISFQNVSFAYDGINPVLRNVSFTVNKGETLAIVGATGAGKSSVINILSRFYEYQEGHISIDGVDVRNIRQKSLRSRLAVVLQDVFLFSRSVADNISLGNERIGNDQIIAAAKAVGAHAFIEKLPEGYDTQVQERGSTLSVGQRQLIAFSRALAADPDILILDEATSSVDTATEQLIEEAISTLLAGRTSIVIAHRLSTVQRADKILVLHRGCLYEQGSHQELLDKDGLYARLYKLQYKDQIAVD